MKTSEIIFDWSNTSSTNNIVEFSNLDCYNK